MATALDTANAKLQSDQSQLQSLQSQLNAAQNDPNIASLKQTIANVQGHYGTPDPWDKNGHKCWCSASGDYWCGTDAEKEWNSAWTQVNANTALIANLQSQIANYTNNVIPQDTDAIQKLTAADPTVAAQAAAITATAQAKVNSSNTILYVIVGAVIVGVIGFVWYIKRKSKTN